MAPSVAQLAPETVNTLEVAKKNKEAQEVKADNVCNFFHNYPTASLFLVYFW